jgi:MFS family permease
MRTLAAFLLTAGSLADMFGRRLLYLTSGLSWRWIFFVNAPIGIAAVIIAPESVKSNETSGCLRGLW